MNIRVFPANVYKTYNEYLKETTYTRKLSLLFDVFGQIIRFFGCVFLSEYMYSEYADSKVNDSIIGLTRPSLGSWILFVREYSKLIYKTTDSFIREFGDCFIEVMNYKKYDKQYIGRFRNQSAKQSNAIEEIIMLRNAIAHGGMSPTEEEATEIVNIYDQYITKILETFYGIFEDYTVAKVDEVEDNLISVTVFFDRIRYDEKHNDRIPREYPDEDIMGEPVMKYFETGQMFLLSKDGRELRLAEYLVDIIDDNEHEDYYLYDGYGNKSVVYIGMKYKKQLEQYLMTIKEKFLEKGARTKWNKAVFDYDSFIEYINDRASAEIHFHEVTHKYNKKVYVERECDHLLDDFISSNKTTMIVTAEAGVGKTNYMCHSAEKLIKKGYGVFFFNGSKLTETMSDNILFHRIQDECLDDQEFRTSLNFLAFINKENKDGIPLILFVDAANEAYDILSVLQEVDTITNHGEEFTWLKIIVSIRSVSFNILKNRITDEYGKKLPMFTIKDRYYSVIKDNRTRYEIEIEEWNIIQVMDAFEKYKNDNDLREDALNYHTMSRELQTLLHNPLNMGLFFWAQVNMPDTAIESEDDLYRVLEAQWNINDEVTRSTLLLQKNIVKEMIGLRQNKLNADDVYKMNDDVTSEKTKDIRLLLLSPLERLKDSGILYEKDEDGFFVISFVYQKYLEYLIAKGFMEKQWDSDKAIEQLLESVDWHNLPEMYVSCLNYLERGDSDNASGLYYAALGRGLKPGEIRTAVIKLWKRRLLSGNTGEVVNLIRKEGLYEWGLELAHELYINEMSKPCYLLVDEMLTDDSPISDELYFQRGLYFMKVSKTDEAQRDFEQCIQISDGDIKTRAIVQLAKNYRKKGEVPEAISILDSLISTSNDDTPYFPDALIQRGLCSYSDNNLTEALDYYERALKISEKNKDHYVSLYNMLGMSTVHAEMGHLDECESILMKVLNRSTDMGYVDLLADCLNGLSANYVRKKEYKKAISYAKQGLFIWKSSDYYTGQAVMYCTIIKALLGLEKKDETLVYMDELNKIMPFIKEEVILNRFIEVQQLLSV